jgi:hypothetical protein
VPGWLFWLFQRADKYWQVEKIYFAGATPLYNPVGRNVGRSYGVGVMVGVNVGLGVKVAVGGSGVDVGVGEGVTVSVALGVAVAGAGSTVAAGAMVHAPSPPMLTMKNSSIIIFFAVFRPAKRDEKPLK